jgi:hypothetical protein
MLLQSLVDGKTLLLARHKFLLVEPLRLLQLRQKNRVLAEFCVRLVRPQRWLGLLVLPLVVR